MLLDVTTWDLVLDANGNWATAAPPYSLAQDVATAIRTFLGEVWYNETDGVPYWQQILGQAPPISLFQEWMVQAALNAVPNTADVYVVSAKCVVSTFDAASRTVTGQVQFVDSNGNPGNVSF
jgi:hypothetical protein